MIYFYLLIAILLAIIALRLTKKDKGFEVFFNVLILGLTAVVLIWNMDTTDRGTDKTLRQKLRPVILHTFSLDGSVDNYWKQLENGSTNVLSFNVYNNIATNIEGYIVLKRNKIPLNLLFSDPVDPSGKFRCPEDSSSTIPLFWITPTRGVCAYLNNASSIKTDKDNEICLQYKDIDGHGYSTREDKNLFSTSSSDDSCD